jgi:hypothetical protein
MHTLVTSKSHHPSAGSTRANKITRRLTRPSEPQPHILICQGCIADFCLVSIAKSVFSSFLTFTMLTGQELERL